MALLYRPTSDINFILQSSKLPTFPIMILYVVIICIAPKLQHLYKPRTFRKTMVIYNISCSALSALAVAWFIYGIVQSGSMFICTNQEHMKPAFDLYCFTKLLELADTVFMLLRQRFGQISFLHVWHHSSMLILTDFTRHGFNFPGTAVPYALNSIVHVVMYGYYALTALRSAPPVSWKRRITELQITQFLIDLVYLAWGFVFHKYCWYRPAVGIYVLAMAMLFANFYYHAYLKRRPEKTENGLHVNGNYKTNGFAKECKKD